MAYEGHQITIPAAEAGGDLSAGQYLCVKKNATARQYVVTTIAGEIFDGVLQDKPNAAGQAASVCMFGISKVYANEALAAGDYWGTANNGKAQRVEHTNTGADLNVYAMGRVIEGAAANGLATVTVGVPSFKTPEV